MPQCLDIYGAIFLDRAPIANFGGAMDDNVYSINGLADERGVGQVANDDLGIQRLQELSIAARSGNSANTEAP